MNVCDQLYRGSERDFDFLHGYWHVSHTRLIERLAGCAAWERFQGTSEVRPILGGAGNVDENYIGVPGAPYRAATLRLFDHETRTWSLHWADERRGRLDAPLTGRFEEGIGLFFGDDEHNGQPIRVRFEWSSNGYDRAQWRQAFSGRDGDWETNWIMDFTRV